MARATDLYPCSYVLKNLETGKVSTYRRIGAFREAIRRDISSECEIKVVYSFAKVKGKEEKPWNSVNVSTAKAGVQFLRECTEKELLEYIAGGEW